VGIFSKGPSTKDQVTNCLNFLSIAFADQSEEIREEFHEIFLSGINISLHRTDGLTKADAINGMNFVRIMTNGVDVNANLEILDYKHRPTDVASTMCQILPFDMPLVVMGPLQMLMEEFIAGKSFDQLDMEVFAAGPARRLVNILIKAVEAMNVKCIREPKRHPSDEIMQMSILIGTILQVGYRRLSLQ
jgi:hypothetical protein